jgi:hypothetical protein
MRELRFMEGVRYGLYHGRPRELLINVALCWRISKSRATRRALVSGYELEERQKRHLLLLAERLDRAVLQGFKEPLWVSAGAGRLSKRLSRLLMALSRLGHHMSSLVEGHDAKRPRHLQL